MESLIKLADPSFSLRPGSSFAEIDKELVLGLLRAVGGVCDGVLKAERMGQRSIVEGLRGRLREAGGVLAGHSVRQERELREEAAEAGEGDMF